MAEYVTDTHPLLWFAGASRGRLSRDVERIFRRCEAYRDTIYVPAAVVWETAYLVQAGSIGIPVSFEEWWEGQFQRPTVVFLPLDLDQVFEARSALNLGDFFDELIIGAARARRLPLLSRDQRITQSAWKQRLQSGVFSSEHQYSWRWKHHSQSGRIPPGHRYPWPGRTLPLVPPGLHVDPTLLGFPGGESTRIVRGTHYALWTRGPRGL